MSAVCERDACGHALIHHEASGPCLMDGCECSGFKLLTRAEREARKSARCSGCGQRVKSGNPHGSARDIFGKRITGRPCPRKGLGPDRPEGWKL